MRFSHQMYKKCNSKEKNDSTSQNVRNLSHKLNFNKSTLWKPEDFQNVNCLKEYSIYNTLYKINDVIIKKDLNKFKFFLIHYIICCQNKAIVFACEEIYEESFNSHYFCYNVHRKKSDLLSIFETVYIRYPPVNIITLPDKKTVIKPKQPFV